MEEEDDRKVWKRKTTGKYGRGRRHESNNVVLLVLLITY